MKIAFVLGTRPEIIKLYSLIKKCQTDGAEFSIIHSNQHYDANMDEAFFKELELPLPNYNLGVFSGRPAAQIAHMISGLDSVFAGDDHDVVVVQGDTNTVLAGAIAANKAGISLAHVEAGLRSHDLNMPEENNRIITDRISQYLFCPAPEQAENLKAEGIVKGVHVTGNTVVDALYDNRQRIVNNHRPMEDLGLQPGEYFLLTCHRPANTDEDGRFSSILEAVDTLAKQQNIPCVFPAHPRLKAKRSLIDRYRNILVTDPVGYLDMLTLQKHSRMIFTDSGGIQEESCILEKKCVILRTNTERPETVEVGGAVLVKSIDKKGINEAYQEIVDKEVVWKNPFGDGKASRHILEIMGRKSH